MVEKEPQRNLRREGKKEKERNGDGGTVKGNMREKFRSEYSQSFFSVCLILGFSLCPRFLLTPLCIVYFRLLVNSHVKDGRFKDATNCASTSIIYPHATWLDMSCQLVNVNAVQTCECCYSMSTTQLLSLFLIENHCQTEALNRNKATVNGD